MSGLAHSNIYIGIDIGTSGIRAIAIDDDEKVVNESRLELPPPSRHGTACEQSPAIWWQICREVLTSLNTSLDSRAIRAIAIDGTSGTVLLTDDHGQPLTMALMYNDARASEQLNRIRNVAPADSPVNAISAGLPKLLWLAEHTQHLPVRHIMHQADWLSFQFTQRPGFSDSNNCLKSGYDPVAGAWPAWIEQLGFPRTWLPTVFVPGKPICRIQAAVATELGLPREVLIVSGTTDSTAGIIATGAQQVGEAITSLGSTLVCKVISEQPVFAAEYGVYSQPFGDNWLVGGASNSGGAVLRQFFSDTQMQQMSEALDPAHPSGLNYYPLPATGERFPVNEPARKPQLSPRPENDVIFFQGLLEGIAQIEYNGYRLLHELGAPYPASVRTVGGGAKNAAWTQIRSRLLKTRMLVATHSEAAFGSALLAKQGFSNYEEKIS